MADLCHLCGHDLADAPTVGRKARYDRDQHNVACPVCGLVQQVPRATEAELAAYYAGAYREEHRDLPARGLDGQMHERGTPEAEAAMDAGAALMCQHIASALGLTPTSEVLEVGCGSGRLAATLRPYVGGRVWAIEPDGRLRSEAAKRGVMVLEQRTLAELCEVEDVDPFDAVIASHVLEHFADPLLALRQMRALLADDGRVWIEVPNVERPYGPIEGHFFQTPHVVNFSPATLALLLLRAGFDGVNVAITDHVIMAHARRGERERSWDEARARFVEVAGCEPPPCAEVVEGLRRYEARRLAREASSARALARWLDGEPIAGLDEAGIRREVAMVADAVSYAIEALGDLATKLDAKAESAGERWSSDPWQLGYLTGEARAMQAANVAISHLANGLIARATR